MKVKRRVEVHVERIMSVKVEARLEEKLARIVVVKVERKLAVTVARMVLVKFVLVVMTKTKVDNQSSLWWTSKWKIFLSMSIN